MRSDIGKKASGFGVDTGAYVETDLIDLHLHAGWTDFDPADQRKRSREDTDARIRDFLRQYRAAGIVMARDAGGYDRPPDASNYSCEVLPNCGMLTGDAAANDEHAAQLEAAVKSPYQWTKIFITGGVGAGSKDVIIPNAGEAQFKTLVKRLHEHGKKVMVHCYGGASLDWCIDSAVETVEHAVYMTREQAGRMAESGTAIVPTTAIYRLLAEKPELFGIPSSIRDNAKRACDAHLRSVKYALDEGVLIGYGTDFYADNAFIDYACYELDTLRDCGLSSLQAEETATVNARRILGL